MPPEETVWPIEPHTAGKHQVLKHYLDAWLPIMMQSNQLVLYVDAFAGPGEYEDGEPGSPLIAIDTLVNHRRLLQLPGRIKFEFIEANLDRYMHLRSMIEQRFPTMPRNATWEAHHNTFNETLRTTLDQLDAQRQRLAPALVMIDPFGVRDTPMSTIKRILRNPKAEVYITFMYDTVNRFGTASQYDDSLTELFGSDRWRDCIKIPEDDTRMSCFVNLYKSELRKAGAQHLLHFTIDKTDRKNYYVIIYATKSLKGCDEMKKAMWRVAPHGEFRFVGGQQDQIPFGTKLVDFDELQRQIVVQFEGKGWCSVAEIEDFVMSDASQFHSGHLRSKALIPMERARVIEVRRSEPGAGFTQGKTMVRFSEKTASEGYLL